MRNTRVLLAALLLAVPLAAQQTVVVPDVDVTVENRIDSIAVGVTVTFPEPDSASVARSEAAERAMRAIEEYLAECGCTGGGTSAIVRVGQGLLTVAAFWIGYQLKRIADREEVTAVDVDVHEHETPSTEYTGEGDGEG